ncbi:MAG: InlB B-repeat-containing protein [Clostridia bacterium]|nr:InlB B-repeat-containing protein [Clostridia bacterium]
MKNGRKIFLTILIFLFSAMALSAFTSCDILDVQKVIDDNKPTVTQLDYPTEISLDEDYVLRWKSVSNVGSYNIYIDNVSYSSPTPSFDLKKINIENGKHEAYIKAIANTSSYSDSELSPVFKFEYDGNVIADDGDKSTGMFGLFDDLYTREAYIGYGYNVIDSDYVNSSEVKTNYRIFDADKLNKKQLIMIKDHNSEDYYISGNSVSTYQASVEAKMSAKVAAKKIFSGSIKAKFKTTTKTTASALFYEYSHTTKAYQLILQCDFEEYKEMLTEAFKRDLLNLDIGTLFNRYGTHVITSVIMGGRFDLSYTMLSDAVIDTASLSASLDTSFKAWGVDTSVDVSTNIEATAKENNTTINVEASCFGGDKIQMNNEKAILSNYQKWLSTIDENPSLVGIRDINSLIPIWELLGDSAEERARKEELAAAFEKYGEETYDSLLENYGIKSTTDPESLDIVLTDKNNKEVDLNKIAAGDTVYLKLNVYPEIATFYKRVSFDKEEYIEYNSVDNTIKIKENTPDETKINVTVNIGHGLEKTLTIWIYKYYTVTFNSNGGSEVAAIDKIRQGARVDEPASPVKEGYTFKHWYYVDEANTQFEYDFNSSVVGNITLFASWEKYSPTITVIHNIEERQNNDYKCEYNKTYDLPQDLTEYGYTFKGYYSDKEMLKAYDESTVYKTNATVYAKWEKNTYTVTFNSNGGTQIESQKVKYNELAVKPEDPTKLGATFGGWRKDVDCLQSFDFYNDVITKDITLYAYFTINGIKIYFDTDGGNEIEKVVIDFGTSLGENLRTPEKAGYTFKGWYNGDARIYSNTVLYENATVTAKWEANTYTVKFNANGGNGNMNDQEFTYDVSQQLYTNNYKRNGYEFLGWSKNANGEKEYFDGQSVKNLANSGEIVLYAVWKANTYTVKFNANGGSGNMGNQTFTYDEAQKLNKNTFERGGYDFLGWATNANAATTEFDNEETVKNLAENGEIVLYAVWKQKMYILDGNYIYFGSYPQSEVTDSSLKTSLNGKAGSLPTNGSNKNWTSYKYYYGKDSSGSESNSTDYMWYQDISYNGEKYRGVYFTSYRPYWTSYSSSAGHSHQYYNGYKISNVYWFKYEPIKWRILEKTTTDEKTYAKILCEMIIDSQDYNYTSNSRTIDGKSVYANNYAYSSIRAWLNDNFYNTAFNEYQQGLIQTVEVDNSARSTNPDNNATLWNSGNNQYACDNTNDKVWLLSEQEVTRAAYGFGTSYSANDTVRRQQTTAYAKCQGRDGWWWLRSPYYYYNSSANLVNYNGDADTVTTTQGNGFGVNNTSNGVVPALKIYLA